MAYPLITLLLLVLTSTFLVPLTSSAKLLFLMPLASRSETHLLNPMASSMLLRGHHVTLVTPSSASIVHPNFTEIIPTTPLDMSDFDPSNHSNVVDTRRDGSSILGILSQSGDFPFISDRCHQTYRHPDFKTHVLEAQSYDLIVLSSLLSECFLGLVHKFNNAPFIMINSLPMMMELVESTGLRTPLSFVPCPMLQFTDKMSLSERLQNTLVSWSYYYISHKYVYTLGEDIYREYLGEDYPSVDNLRRKVSIIFANTHFSINFPRPLLPDIVEIGGVHTRKAEALPKELEEFCSGGEGFIFFSLGTVFRDGSLPESVKQIFINVFSRLKHIRVLWKWEKEIENLPGNVKVGKWLPQQDILGHENIKLFISHGGLLSTQEATYHGVPVLGIPLFSDQDVNMKQVEAHGYGIKLELLDLTEEYFENAIHKMLNDPSFAENAKQASEIFRDQPETPLERSVYWMEYVFKYKGAPQLRSSSRDLSGFQYHLYDVQLILLSIVLIFIYLVWKAISICLTCFGMKKRMKSRKTENAKSTKKYQ